MNINDWFQWCLLFISGYTIYLVSEKRYARAAVVGLFSEIFWMGASLTSGQWSIALLTFWYTWCYWKMAIDNKLAIKCLFRLYKKKVQKRWNLLWY